MRRLLGLAASMLAAGLPLAAPAQGSLAAQTGGPGVTAAALPSGAQRFESPGTRGRLVVVLLPGTAVDPAAGAATAAELARQLQATVLLMPGPLKADRGEVAQGADPASVDRTAGALRQVRDAYPGRKLLLAGLGEGAGLAALLAGREPRSADAFLLAACACDGAAGASAAGVRPDARMAVVVGTRDDRTPSRLSERYVTGLQARGVKTRLTYAMNATHVSVQRSPEFFMLAQGLADELLR